MDQQQTIELWERCEKARAAKRAEALAAGKSKWDADVAGTAAATEIWNAWADRMLAERKALQAAGEWVAEKKDASPFEAKNEATAKWKEAAAVDFSSFPFGFDMILDREKPQGRVVASNRVSNEEVRSVAAEAEFARFDGFVFPGRASFDGAKFAHGAAFWFSQFLGVSSFKGTQFDDITFFIAAQFTGDVSFDSAQFTDAAFHRAQFTGDAVLSGAQFKESAWFEDAQFTGNTQFNNALFADLARFTRTQFTGEASFRGAQFADQAWFEDAQFAAETHFNDAQFKVQAVFTRAQFKGHAWFQDAQFTRHTSFNSARFMGGAVFWGTQFDGVVFFDNSEFDEATTFRSANFGQFASFDKAHFRKTTDFMAVRGERAFTMTGALFHEVPIFSQAHFSEAPRLDDLRIGVTKAESSLFHSLRQRSTDGSEAIEARFRALRRLAVQGHDHENERLFLKGEIRSRRRTVDQPWHAAFWFGLAYDTLSDFGGSIARPVYWGAATVLAFAALYVWLAPGACPASAELLGQALFLSLKNAVLLISWDSVMDGAKASLCLKAPEGASIWPTLGFGAVQMLQKLCSAVLWFLLLLAVRNRFRIR